MSVLWSILAWSQYIMHAKTHDISLTAKRVYGGFHHKSKQKGHQAVKLVSVKRHRAADGLSSVCETYTPRLRSKTPLDPEEHRQLRPAVHMLRDLKKYFTHKRKSSALTRPCIVLNRMTASLHWNQKLCF